MWNVKRCIRVFIACEFTILISFPRSRGSTNAIWWSRRAWGRFTSWWRTGRGSTRSPSSGSARPFLTTAKTWLVRHKIRQPRSHNSSAQGQGQTEMSFFFFLTFNEKKKNLLPNDGRLTLVFWHAAKLYHKSLTEMNVTKSGKRKISFVCFTRKGSLKVGRLFFNDNIKKYCTTIFPKCVF